VPQQNERAIANLKAPWKRGQSGNPSGKTKGSRTALSHQFMVDLHAVWMERGEGIISYVLEEHPLDFFKAVVHLMPKHVKLSDDTPNTTSPAQRAAALLGAFRTLVNGGYLENVAGAIGSLGAPSPAGSGSGADGPIIDVPAVPKAEGVP